MIAHSKLFKLTDVKTRLLVYIVILTVFGLINPVVVSFPNIINLINNATFFAVAALGLLVVMVTGNLDLSLMSIALMSGYGTVLFYKIINYEGDYFTMFIIAGCIGACAGMFNGYIVRKFDLPGFVVSIATKMVFSSVIFVFLKSGYIQPASMPKNIIRLSYDCLIEFKLADGSKPRLSIGFLLLIVMIIVIWFILNRTQIGRGIYALGGDKVALERVGYNVPLVYSAAYGIFGFLCGTAGILFYANQQMCEVQTLLGKEATVIASAIFGGANLKEGKGTVGGTLIGVAIVTLINDNLVLLGVVPYAKILVIGVIILTSVLISSLSDIRRTKTQ